MALDDVGAGNAGLEMLRSYRFDFVKVDRTVIQSASQLGSNGKAVLLAILAFATESGAQVIAEGVEEEESAAMLRHIGNGPSFAIDAIQGFLLSEPLPSMDAVIAELSKRAA